MLVLVVATVVAVVLTQDSSSPSHGKIASKPSLYPGEITPETVLPARPAVAVGVQTHSIKAADAFSALIGRPVTRVEVYMNDTSWEQLETPWFADPSVPDEYWPGWVKASPGRELVISQGMAPDNPPPDWRAAGARGDYDAHFTAFAKNLVADGLGTSIIRLAWEMNYDQFAGHYTGSSATDVSNWKAYFARIVGLMRAVPGGHFTIDFNPNTGGSSSGLPFEAFYPGDDSVDIIGLDIYDNSFDTPGRTLEQRWAAQYNGMNGLRDFQSFARKHDKPMSLPEWALVAVNPRNQNFGAGDNPLFINRIADFIKVNKFAYESYFDSADGGVGMRLSDAPKSVAAFGKRFGDPGDAVAARSQQLPAGGG